MKPLILFLSLLLAFSGCKSKLQSEELNSIVGKWELIGYITRDCNKEKPDVFSPEDGVGFFSVITYYNNLSYESSIGGSLVYVSCPYSKGTYSLSKRNDADGTPVKIVSTVSDSCSQNSVASDEQYDIVRAPNGDIHLQLSSSPPDCSTNDNYTVYVYKKVSYAKGIFLQ